MIHPQRSPSRPLIFAFSAMAFGCGGSPPIAGTDVWDGGQTNGDQFETGDVDLPDDDGDIDGDIDLPGDGDSGGYGDRDMECNSLAAILAEQMFFDFQECTIVVRLTYQNPEVLGYQIVCGEVQVPTAAEALSVVDPNGDREGSPPDMLNPDEPGDEYIFYAEPFDLGWVAAVSANTGQRVFDGEIVWMGTGDINFPVTWKEPTGFNHDCGIPTALPDFRLYDLCGDSQGDGISVLYQMMGTAISRAFAQRGESTNAVVLCYPRTTGAFSPSNAEWIVFFNTI